MVIDGGPNRPSDSLSPTPLGPVEQPHHQKSADLGNSRAGGDGQQEKQPGAKPTLLQRANLTLATLAFVVNGGFGLPAVHTAAVDRRSQDSDKHQIVTSAAPASGAKSSAVDSRDVGAQVRAAAPDALATGGGAESDASPDPVGNENERGEGQEREAQYWEQKKKEEESAEAGESALNVDAVGQETTAGPERRSAELSSATSATQISADLLSSRFPSVDPVGRS